MPRPNVVLITCHDLGSDPGELRDLIDDPAYSEQADRLRAALDAHLESTDDPFRHLNNPIPMPEDVYARVRGGK